MMVLFFLCNRRGMQDFLWGNCSSLTEFILLGLSTNTEINVILLSSSPSPHLPSGKWAYYHLDVHGLLPPHTHALFPQSYPFRIWAMSPPQCPKCWHIWFARGRPLPALDVRPRCTASRCWEWLSLDFLQWRFMTGMWLFAIPEV